MKTTHQLAMVIEVAAQRRDESLRALGKAQNELEQARQQLAQLQDYAAESQARWQQRAMQGVSASLMQHQRQFMARIDHAVTFQADVMSGLEQAIARCRLEVSAAERELASLNKYAERRERAWQQEQQRQEQKATDETAAQAHQRQKNASHWSRTS